MRVYAPALDAALERYLRFGGLPASVAEAASGAHEPSQEVKRVLYDSLIRELQRKGASVPAGHALLERVVRSLGSKLSWSSMAREMDVPLGRGTGPPSHQTLRDYIELLAAGYFLFVTYFWRGGSHTNELSRDKKVFLADPLLHTIALDGAPGLAFNTPRARREPCGDGLLRRYEPPERLLETFVLPSACTSGRPRVAGRSTSSAAPRRTLVDLVEVKYRETRSLSAARPPARAFTPVVRVVKSTKEHVSCCRALHPGARPTPSWWALG